MFETFLKLLYKLLVILFSLLIVPLFFALGLISRFIRKNLFGKVGVIFGIEPLISYKYFSEALKCKGFRVCTVSTHKSPIISDSDFDLFLNKISIKNFNFHLSKSIQVRMLFHFAFAICKYDFFVFSCHGYLFHHINLGLLNYRIERLIFKVAGIKTVVIPFGSDSYVYRRTSDISIYYPLLTQYPTLATKQREITKRVDYWVDNANYFLPGAMALDGFGRSDLISPSAFCIDTASMNSKSKKNHQKDERITITHAPNHRAVKGTDKLIQVIDELKIEGFKVRLLLLEGMPNAEVLKVLREESDIHVDQLFMNGYAFNAIEAMSLGLPVVGHFSESYLEFFTTFSYLSECPIQSVNIASLKGKLIELILDPQLRTNLGIAGIQYTNKYHSYEHFANSFMNLTGVASSDKNFKEFKIL